VVTSRARSKGPGYTAGVAWPVCFSLTHEAQEQTGTDTPDNKRRHPPLFLHCTLSIQQPSPVARNPPPRPALMR